MDIKDYNHQKDFQTEKLSDEDSGMYMDEESARLELAGIFSSKFTNINQFYSSPSGATEIHTAVRYGKRFILKGLRREYRDDPVCNMCMAKEFEIGIALDHPNIRRTFGLEKVDGLGKTIVLEYIDGHSLADALSAGTITPERAVSICRQIADALKYLHSKQICHRDLKPENILLPYQGDTVKIIDFNLSDRDDYLVLKNPAGSKRYMAPELLDPDYTPTPETDYYSLGVVMKELAEVSSNSTLARAAKRCMNPDPTKRKEGIYMLENESDMHDGESLPDRILSSPALTYVFSAICLGLITYITIHYLY